jgi:hypothetical protein
MREKNDNKLNRTFLALLQPLARLFLRFGRGYREYSELSKAAFVSVAAEDYGVQAEFATELRLAKRQLPSEKRRCRKLSRPGSRPKNS